MAIVKIFSTLLLLISICKVFGNPSVFGHPNVIASPTIDSGGSVNLKKLLGAEDVNQCFHETNQTQMLSNIDDVSRIMLDGAKFFAIRLFKTLNLFEPKHTSKGIIFSPASIWSTMVIAYLGSEGETAQELSDRLKLKNLSKSSVALAYRSIKWWKDLKMNANNHHNNKKADHSSKTSVSSANKLYIDESITLNDCFERIFHDEIESKPFSSHPDQCVAEINGWVNDQTKG